MRRRRHPGARTNGYRHASRRNARRRTGKTPTGQTPTGQTPTEGAADERPFQVARTENPTPEERPRGLFAAPERANDPNAMPDNTSHPRRRRIISTGDAETSPLAGLRSRGARLSRGPWSLLANSFELDAALAGMPRWHCQGMRPLVHIAAQLSTLMVELSTRCYVDVKHVLSRDAAAIP